MIKHSDYEEIILDSLVAHNDNNHLWVKKVTELGVSESLLPLYVLRTNIELLIFSDFWYKSKCCLSKKRKAQTASYISCFYFSLDDPCYH